MSWIGAYFVLVALMVGSFINLAADRIPRAESLVTPRSHCRSCGRVLNVVDLVPVLGWALRGGRCATCRTPIGAASPVVEAACGAAMVAGLISLGLWPGAVVGGVAVAAIGILVIAVAIKSFETDSVQGPSVRRSGSPSDTGSAGAHRTR